MQAISLSHCQHRTICSSSTIILRELHRGHFLFLVIMFNYSFSYKIILIVSVMIYVVPIKAKVSIKPSNKPRMKCFNIILLSPFIIFQFHRYNLQGG